MTKIMERNNGKSVIGFLIGAAIGTGLGILFAPKKGSKTRRRIKYAVDDVGHDISDWLNHAKDELAKTAHNNKEAFDEKLDDAVSTMSHKAEDIITRLENKLKEVKEKNAQLHN